MPSLRDIKRAVETVEIGGVKVEVLGITSGDLETIWNRFPDLGKVMNGVKPDMMKLLRTMPDAAAAIIAAAVEKLGDKEEEAFVKTLDIGAQLELLAAIRRATLPRGIDPLVELADGLGGRKAPQPPPGPAAPSDTTSPKPS